MHRNAHRVIPLLIALLAGLCLAQMTNLSGTWHLDVSKSRWGKKQKPVSIAVNIDHREPELKYSGTLVDAQGDGRHFQFSGAIDGRDYPMASGQGPGKVRIQRVDANSLTSVFTTDDGLFVETTKTVLSRDGKLLTRYIRLKGPEGETSWTEVYHKH